VPAGLDVFLDTLNGKPGAPLVTVREAASRSAVMEAIYRGAKRKGWVKLP